MQAPSNWRAFFYSCNSKISSYMSGYPDSLIYYMWGWQIYFRISCQTGAECLFKHLDNGLDPQITLIGFRIKDDSTTQPICFEPERLKSIPPTAVHVGLTLEKVKVLNLSIEKLT